jgi:hypothetical protein
MVMLRYAVVGNGGVNVPALIFIHVDFVIVLLAPEESVATNWTEYVPPPAGIVNEITGFCKVLVPTPTNVQAHCVITPVVVVLLSTNRTLTTLPATP